MRIIRAFLQYLVLTAAGMLLLLGVGWLRTAPRIAEPEPVGVTTAQEDAAESPQPPVTTQASTCPPPELEDVVDVLALEAAHVFAYDVQNRQMVLCTSDPAQRLYPASITKLFSAWVALQWLAPDAAVTAGWELGFLQPGSSQAFIALDSRLTVEMLIEGMLLPSGNDAALVLAAAVGRRALGKEAATASEAVAAFVEQMNIAAGVLGFANSHFTNPDGYHHEDHYSCPEDLAVIAWLALDEPVIRRCMGLQQDTVTFLTGQVHHWRNTNRLLDPESEYYSPAAVGMKTGYTGSAGYCLMAAFGETRPLVVGIFGATDPVSRYTDASRLYEAWAELSE